jgi:hypothetical protein
LLRSDLDVVAIEIKDLKHKLDYSSRYIVLSLPCEACVYLKGKLFHATKENIELQQEVDYLTTCLDKTVLSEKMIDDDLSRVKESTTKSTYRLRIVFERCEKRNENDATKFISSSSYHREEEALKPTKTHYPSNLRVILQPKERCEERIPQVERGSLCMHVLWSCWSLGGVLLPT